MAEFVVLDRTIYLALRHYYLEAAFTFLNPDYNNSQFRRNDITISIRRSLNLLNRH
jgi:hypothetical protein